MKGFFKKCGIYFDTKVKKGSNNAVTSNAVAKAIEEGGGGGGTTDYTDLTNKPKINNVELSGNKSLETLGIASKTGLDTLSDNVGDLAELATTEKTSIVGAINEIANGGSSSGVKYRRFANKATNTTTSISGITYVAFMENNVKTWFDEAPTTIHALMTCKSGGAVVKNAIKNATNAFITEQANSAVTYDYVGVFYE